MMSTRFLNKKLLSFIVLIIFLFTSNFMMILVQSNFKLSQNLPKNPENIPSKQFSTTNFTKYSHTISSTSLNIFGGTGDDLFCNHIIDSENNIYIIGSTNSSDFPITENAIQKDYQGNGDIFLCKFAPNMEDLLFSTYLGGSEVDKVPVFCLDKQDNIIIAGITRSPDFPTSFDAFQRTNIRGNYDIIVTKVDSTIGEMLASTYIGGNQGDYPNSVAVDQFDRIVITGTTYSSDYPTTPNATQTKSNSGSHDGFLTIINSDLSHLCYSTYIGDRLGDRLIKLVIREDLCYLLGTTASESINLSNITVEKQSGLESVDSEVCLFIFNLTSQEFIKGLIFHTITDSISLNFEMKLDHEDNIFIAGQVFDNSLVTILNAIQPQFGGGRKDIFIAKFSPLFEKLEFSSYLGGKGNEVLSHLSLKSPNTIVLNGKTNSPDFSKDFSFLNESEENYSNFYAEIRLDRKKIEHIIHFNKNSYYLPSVHNSPDKQFIFGETKELNFTFDDLTFINTTAGYYDIYFISREIPKPLLYFKDHIRNPFYIGGFMFFLLILICSVYMGQLFRMQRYQKKWNQLFFKSPPELQNQILLDKKMISKASETKLEIYVSKSYQQTSWDPNALTDNDYLRKITRFFY